MHMFMNLTLMNTRDDLVVTDVTLVIFSERKSVVIIESSSEEEEEGCTCFKSTGNTQIMCKFCRVSPVPKKPSKCSYLQCLIRPI